MRTNDLGNHSARQASYGKENRVQSCRSIYYIDIEAQIKR